MCRVVLNKSLIGIEVSTLQQFVPSYSLVRSEKQRRMATGYLLEKVSWAGMSEFKAGLTASCTRLLCDAMTVSKDLMANLLLTVGGKSGICTGGGGSNSELTNWDGTKKRNGWG